MTICSKALAGSVGAAFIALGLATSAQADGYSAPRVAYERPFSWTGFYIGANAGWERSDVDWVFHDPSGVGAPNFGLPDRPIGRIGQEAGIYGAHAGYQAQLGALVLGLEAAISFPDEDFGPSRPCPVATFNCQAKTNYLATIGPRLGWAFSNWMVFGTGGFAHGEIDTQAAVAATGVVDSRFSTRAGQDGWFAGAGLEYAIHRNVVLGVEYQHIGLFTNLHEAGNVAGAGPNPGGNNPAAPLGTGNQFVNYRNITADYDIVRARLSFKFDNEERVRPLK